MKTLITAWLVLGLATTPLLSQNQKADAHDIRQIDLNWSASLGKKDLDGVLSVYAEDAVFLAPNQPILEGKKAIRAWFKRRFDTPGYHASFVTTKIAVSRSGDMAWEIGSYKARHKNADGATLQSVGKHLVTWERRGDGWVVIAESINGDAPNPTVVSD